MFTCFASKNFPQKSLSLALFTSLGIATLTACTPADNKPKADNTTTANSVAASTQAQTALEKKPIIYTSTSMWQAVAKAIAGDKAEVVTSISSPNQDPHEYQASAQDKLAMQNANLILVNGGGYDDWALQVANSLPNKPVVIDAFAISGLDKSMDTHQTDKPANKSHDEHSHSEHSHEEHSHDEHSHAEHASEHKHKHGEINEHIFYSLDSVQKVATRIANQLVSSDPANQATYLQNNQAFNDKIGCLKNKAHAVQSTTKPVSAIATESVSDYLLADMGINNITPPAYVTQSETGAGVSAKVLQDTKALLANKSASLLVVNSQTEDATAKQLIDTAKSAKAAIVSVQETLPTEATGYISYMNATMNNFYKTLNGENAQPLSECQ